MAGGVSHDSTLLRAETARKEDGLMKQGGAGAASPNAPWQAGNAITHGPCETTLP